MINASSLLLQSPNLEILRQRALKSLANPSEICDDILFLALQDSNEACKGRDVPNYIRVDFAYVRLKLYLKIDLNGEDEMLFKNAMDVIAKSNTIDMQGEINSSKFYASCRRKETIW